MSQPADERPRARATALVVSNSSVFHDILNDMLVDCGFAAATPARAEPAWLSVTRTQPALVICDCGDRGVHVKPLVVEAMARHLPLLLATGTGDRCAPQLWVLPERVAQFEFPIDREAFRALIDGLMMPTHILRRTVAVSAGGLALNAGLTTRTLAEVATAALPGAVRTLEGTTVPPLRETPETTPP